MDRHDRGWRWVFFSFAIPGTVIAVLWYLLVRTGPSESAFVSKAELETITAGQETPDARRENIVISPGFARLDRLIRVRELAPVSTVKGLFTSKNILGDCGLFYDGQRAVRTVDVDPALSGERGFTFMSMGLVASMPCIGGFIGAILAATSPTNCSAADVNRP